MPTRKVFRLPLLILNNSFFLFHIFLDLLPNALKGSLYKKISVEHLTYRNRGTPRTYSQIR